MVEGGPGRTLRIVLGAAVYFGIVFGVGFVLGAVRVSVVVPRLGERLAELLEMPFMFVAIYLAAGHVVGRLGRTSTAPDLLRVGILALALLVSAELLLAVALAGRGLIDYVAGRDPVSGSVYLAMLVLFAAMPWLRRTGLRAAARSRA